MLFKILKKKKKKKKNAHTQKERSKFFFIIIFYLFNLCLLLINFCFSSHSLTEIKHLITNDNIYFFKQTNKQLSVKKKNIITSLEEKLNLQ